MYKKRFCGLVPSLFCIAALVGCAPGPKLQAYLEPTLDDSQVAVLKGYGGTYVTIVDNQEVKGTFLKVSNWGGNTIRLAPGRHDLTVSRSRGGTNYTQEVSLPLTHDFEAGHKYEIGPEHLVEFKFSLVLKDVTAGTEVAIIGGDSQEDSGTPGGPVELNLQARGPTYDEMDVSGNRVEIEFDDNGAPLTTFDDELPTGFVIAGKDQVFHPAKAVIISEDTVIVWNEAVLKPAAVRLGSETNLCNRNGGKAVPFRTDKWKVESVTATESNP